MGTKEARVLRESTLPQSKVLGKSQFGKHDFPNGAILKVLEVTKDYYDTRSMPYEPRHPRLPLRDQFVNIECSTLTCSNFQTESFWILEEDLIRTAEKIDCRTCRFSPGFVCGDPCPMCNHSAKRLVKET